MQVANWRLKIEGDVEAPFELIYAEVARNGLTLNGRTAMGAVPHGQVGGVGLLMWCRWLP